MIARLLNATASAWRQLLHGPCEDVGTMLEEWTEARARAAWEQTRRLDEGLVTSSHLLAFDREGLPTVSVRTVDADTANALRIERTIAGLLAAKARE